jgi:hypothetical protein
MRRKLFILLLLSLLTTVSASFGADYGFHIEASGFWGYCGEDEQSSSNLNWCPTIVNGAMAEIVLGVYGPRTPPRDVSYSGQYRGWPQGLELSVGRWDTTTRTCHWDSTLLNQFRFRHKKGPEIHNVEVAFTFTVPDTLAEQYLCINARWNGSEWGDLSGVPVTEGYNERLGGLGNPRPLIIKIKAPCSDADRQLSRDWKLRETWVVGEVDQTFALADSFLTQGWVSFAVLMHEYGAGLALGKYELALKSLDQCYQTYGRTTDMPADSTERSRIYHLMRSQLLDKKQQKP